CYKNYVEPLRFGPARIGQSMTFPRSCLQGIFTSTETVQASYDNVARAYAHKLYMELAGKPFDRERLDLFARRVKGRRVCDLGCGPAQVARYLRDREVDAFGLDLSAGMPAEARRLNPDLPLVQSSMLSLGLRSEVLNGIAAFYCILHIPRDQIPSALGEMRRVLK